ncbi:glycosyl hydrolase family 47-domain-containing protein [Leptodontidium sp. 2 PMI_412]|nr:glycosyl hydrolase family 47-domain-containing protein [Leptodontidium sp. 2 PMI_412]
MDSTHKEGCNINLFETTIRYLAGGWGLLAWDLSGEKYPILVEKAVELGEVFYTAFNTLSRMPTPYFTWSASDPEIRDHSARRSIVLAVSGSLSLEFTRLAQIIRNDKYFDGIQKIINELEKWQDDTTLLRIQPAMVDSARYNYSVLLGFPCIGGEEQLTLGALANSTYEYLPKKFIKVAKQNLFFRPIIVNDEDLFIFGIVDLAASGDPRFSPDLQHLTCFAGGMLAIAGKIFNRPEDVIDGGKLADGCVWAYRNTVTGIIPETFKAVPCENKYHADSAVADLNLLEHLVLADCGIGHDPAHPDWAKSFQMLYYKGAVWNNPDLSSSNRPNMVAQVPWDGQYPWRAQWNWQGSKGTFPNGDVFSAVAFPGIADPNLAETVTHIYEPHPLRCFSFHKARFLHQLADGQRCSTAYVRNHQEGNQLQIGTSPSPPAEQKVNTRVSINKDKAILNGNAAFDDIFNLAKINDDICDESTIEVPNSRDRWGGPCSIKFRCHGNKKGLAEAMRTGLKNTAKESDMFYHNLHQTKRVWNPCKSGRD